MVDSEFSIKLQFIYKTFLFIHCQFCLQFRDNQRVHNVKKTHTFTDVIYFIANIYAQLDYVRVIIK